MSLWKEKAEPNPYHELTDLEQVNQGFMDIGADVAKELGNAFEKHPVWPKDILHAFAIFNEEVGEVQKDVLQWVYEPNGEEKIEKEMIQALAMGVRFLLYLRAGKLEDVKS